MREIGYGDTGINKNMKLLVTTLYNILLNCEYYQNNDFNKKNFFLRRYLDINKNAKNADIAGLVDYFNKYQSFCLDLSSVNVLKGDLNFNYK